MQKFKLVFIVVLVVMIVGVLFLRNSADMTSAMVEDAPSTDVLVKVEKTIDKNQVDVKVETPVVPVEKPKEKQAFLDDVEAMDAYNLCLENKKSLRQCVNNLGKTYSVSGFILLKDATAESTPVLAEYLTLKTKEHKISLNYKDGSVLLGDYSALAAEARENKLPEGLSALILSPVKKIWPIIK